MPSDLVPTRVMQVFGALLCGALALLYLAWLAIAAWQTGHHHLPAGDIMRWGLAVLLPAAAIVLIGGAGLVWWVTGADTSGPLGLPRGRWTWLGFAFTAFYSVFAGTWQTQPGTGPAIGSAVLTLIGMSALFVLPMLCSPKLGRAVHATSRQG